MRDSESCHGWCHQWWALAVKKMDLILLLLPSDQYNQLLPLVVMSLAVVWL